MSHQAAAHSGCVVSIKHSPADVTLVCMRARGVYSIHRGGDILATHQGKGGIFYKQGRGCYSHHTLVEDDLVRVWSIPGQRSCGAEEAGTALGGVPAVPVIIIIIIIIMS